MVIRTPMIEITTIGAGGGSIARIDAGGLLAVGPDSAGSRPGPVAYGQGNTRPTLTDANIVLRRINADKPIGGKLARLDVEAARAAIEAHVGKPLRLGVEAAAEAIVRIANARMAGAIRIASVERGHDPARFVAVPFGGGGALHAGALIKDVGLRAALVPRYPGVTSALGCIIADVRHDEVATVNLMLDRLDVAALNSRIVAAGRVAYAVVAASHLTIDRIDVTHELDMHYEGQTHTVAVPLPVTPIDGTTGITRDIVQTAFESAYAKAFSRVLPDIAVRIVNMRTTANGRRPKFDLGALAPDKSETIDGAGRGTRPVWFDGRWHETTIWDRLRLPVGAKIAGPAVFEQADATTVVEPGLGATVDRFGNLIIARL